MLKGHATIELKNVNTGEIQRYEHSNLVTNAIAENLTLASKVITPSSVNDKFMPLNKLGMGGILLFENTLTEGANNVMLPSPSENTITGYASNDAYNSTDTKRGSRNGTESQVIDNGFKYVWDFSTSQANGIISAIALTHSKTGATPYGYFSESYLSTISATSYENNMLEFNINTNEITNIYTNGNRGIIVRKKRLPIDKIRINTSLLSIENVGEPIRYDYSDSGITFNENSKIINSDDNYYYIVYANGTTLSFCRINKDDYSIDTEYGLKNVTLETNATVNSTSYYRNAVVMNGYMYVFYSSTIHKININDVGNYESISTNYTAYCCAKVGNTIMTNRYIYSENSNGVAKISPRPIYNTSGGIVTGGTTYNIIVYDNGIALDYKMSSTSTQIELGVTLAYLATINNLETPIQKTSAQTMKITYTLTES